MFMLPFLKKPIDVLVTTTLVHLREGPVRHLRIKPVFKTLRLPHNSNSEPTIIGPLTKADKTLNQSPSPRFKSSSVLRARKNCPGTSFFADLQSKRNE